MHKLYRFPLHNEGGFFSIAESGNIWLTSVLPRTKYTIQCTLDTYSLEKKHCDGCDFYKSSYDIEDEVYKLNQERKQKAIDEYEENLDEDEEYDENEIEYDQVYYNDYVELNDYCTDTDNFLTECCFKGYNSKDHPDIAKYNKANIETPKLGLRLNTNDGDNLWSFFLLEDLEKPGTQAIPYVFANVFSGTEKESIGKICWGNNLNIPKDHREAESAFFYGSTFNEDLSNFDDDNVNGLSLSEYFENYSWRDLIESYENRSYLLDLKEVLYHSNGLKLSTNKKVLGFFISDGYELVTQIKQLDSKAVYPGKYYSIDSFVAGWVYSINNSEKCLVKFRKSWFLLESYNNFENPIYLGELNEVL